MQELVKKAAIQPDTQSEMFKKYYKMEGAIIINKDIKEGDGNVVSVDPLP